VGIIVPKLQQLKCDPYFLLKAGLHIFDVMSCLPATLHVLHTFLVPISYQLISVGLVQALQNITKSSIQRQKWQRYYDIASYLVKITSRISN